MQLAMTPDQRPVSIPVDPAPSVETWGNGRRSYGGRDLDQLFLDYLCRGWDPEIVKKNRQSLLRDVRRFKEGFSNRINEGGTEHKTLWLVGEDARQVSLTRGEFEQFAGEYIAQFEVLLKGALVEARLAPRQVTHLVLTGGHSRWYFVDQALTRLFPHLLAQGRHHPAAQSSRAERCARTCLCADGPGKRPGHHGPGAPRGPCGLGFRPERVARGDPQQRNRRVGRNELGRAGAAAAARPVTAVPDARPAAHPGGAVGAGFPGSSREYPFLQRSAADAAGGAGGALRARPVGAVVQDVVVLSSRGPRR